MRQIIKRALNAFYYVSLYWYYKLLFGKLGYRSRIKSSGLRIEHPKNIYIGNRVVVGEGSWLAASPHVVDNPRLIIEDNVNLGRYNQIYSTATIVIEKAVLTADRVFISDGVHNFLDISTPIMNQIITSKGNIIIGQGSWIGINACIIGASIGKNCVVAANSVVTSDIPDFCVVGGIPAIILKRYNTESKIWEKTDKEGNFLN